MTSTSQLQSQIAFYKGGFTLSMDDEECVYGVVPEIKTYMYFTIIE